MKRSLRDYLLTLIIAVVIFAIAAVFLISFAENLMGDVVEKVGSSEQNETPQTEIPQTGQPAATSEPVDNPVANPDQITNFLILGLDRSGKHADAIFLVGINSTKNTMTCALIPSNTYVLIDNVKNNLGDLYSTRSVSYVESVVQVETGILPDYYFAISMDGLANMIDFIGGIPYNVPQNMYYFDSTQNLKINLQSGQQTLSGDQAIGLLSFRGYTSGLSGRQDTQLNFVKTFCSAFLTPANAARAKEILYNIYYNVDSDFSTSDFLTHSDLIFNFPSYNTTFTRIPGAAASDGFYGISTSKATSLFSSYKK